MYNIVMASILPTVVKRYFWGDDLTQLSWSKHQKYITQTLLEKGDIPALQWLFRHINRQDIKTMLPTLKLSLKSRNFWRIYLS